MTTRPLFLRPGVRPMMLSGIVGRLPMGMMGLALTLLIVGQAGSYALAGAVSATMTISLAIMAPYNARLTDRIGQGRAIPILLSVNVTSFLLLAAAVGAGWPVPMWFGFAALAGMSMPGLGAMTRARWVGIAENGNERSSAFAYESVADELAFVVGPVVASALAISLAPVAPVLVGAAALMIGGLTLAVQRRTAPEPGRNSGRPRAKGHAIGFRGMATMFAVMLTMGAMFGALHVSNVAFAQAYAPSATGLLLATVSLGSLVSGVILGLTRRRWSLTNQVRLGMVTLVLALAPLPFISWLPLFTLVSFLLGLNFSVIMIGSFGLAERMTPRARITEGLALMGSGLSLGTAAGVWLAGIVIDAAGPHPAFAVAAGFATAASLLFWLRSSTVADIERGADAAEQSVAPIPASQQAGDERDRPHQEALALA